MSAHGDTFNPYATPEANVQTTPENGEFSFIQAFDRFTAWGVFGLMIITLGFYMYYWMYSRGKALNTQLPKGAGLSSQLTVGVVLLGIVYTAMSWVPEQVMAEWGIAFFGLLMGIFVIYLVGFLVWIFKFRNRLNELTGAEKGDKLWLGGIMTFFFNVIYFQYKINQIHDNA